MTLSEALQFGQAAANADGLQFVVWECRDGEFSVRQAGFSPCDAKRCHAVLHPAELADGFDDLPMIVADDSDSAELSATIAAADHGPDTVSLAEFCHVCDSCSRPLDQFGLCRDCGIVDDRTAELAADNPECSLCDRPLDEFGCCPRCYYHA